MTLKLGPMSIERAMAGFSRHDPAHIDEIKKALG